MKKHFSALLASLMLVGCASGTAKPETTATPEATTEPTVETVEVSGLNILTPTGAPALSLIPVSLSGNNTIVSVDGADALQAELVNPSGEYDVVIAPTNLGTKLAIAGKTDYRMLAVVTWGNLYFVSSDEEALSKDGELAVFGEQAVPGLVFNSLYSEVTPNIRWYNSAQEAAAALLSGNADVAMLAEPMATATIAKAKEAGKELKIIGDVQKEWGENGYPQAALFVRKDAYEANKEVYDAMVVEMSDYATAVDVTDASAVVNDIDTVGAETFGLSASAIIGKVYGRMGIHVVKASECESELADFLKLFGIENCAEAIIK